LAGAGVIAAAAGSFFGETTLWVPGGLALASGLAYLGLGRFVIGPAVVRAERRVVEAVDVESALASYSLSPIKQKIRRLKRQLKSLANGPADNPAPIP
jgi:hypothetical protein